MLIAFIIFLIIGIFKIHSGSVYPSDVLTTLPVSMIISAINIIIIYFFIKKSTDDKNIINR